MDGQQQKGKERGFTPVSIAIIVVLPLFAGYVTSINSGLLFGFLLWGTFAFWLIHEHFLVPTAGGRNPSPSDRGTIRLLSITKLIAWVVGPVVALLVTPLAISGGNQVVVGAGIVTMWLGVGLRRWAIWTLGVFFRRDIAVQEGHEVIQRGPFAVVRHPSYSGDLLTFVGLGVALASWTSVVTCFVAPLFGYIRRLLVEEDVLQDSLGGAYSEYKGKTRWRLLPGVW